MDQPASRRKTSEWARGPLHLDTPQSPNSMPLDVILLQKKPIEDFSIQCIKLNRKLGRKKETPEKKKLELPPWLDTPCYETGAKISRAVRWR